MLLTLLEAGALTVMTGAVASAVTNAVVVVDAQTDVRAKQTV